MKNIYFLKSLWIKIWNGWDNGLSLTWFSAGKRWITFFMFLRMFMVKHSLYQEKLRSVASTRASGSGRYHPKWAFFLLSLRYRGSWSTTPEVVWGSSRIPYRLLPLRSARPNWKTLVVDPELAGGVVYPIWHFKSGARWRKTWEKILSASHSVSVSFCYHTDCSS